MQSTQSLSWVPVNDQAESEGAGIDIVIDIYFVAYQRKNPTDEELVYQQRELIFECDPPDYRGLGCRQPGLPSVMCIVIRLSQTEQSKAAQPRILPNLLALSCAVFLDFRIR